MTKNKKQIKKKDSLLINLLKNFRLVLIPSKKYSARAHLTKTSGLSVIALLLILVQITFNYIAVGKINILGYASNINSGDLIAQTNYQRSLNGLAALNYNSTLSNAALAKAQNMMANNYWDHIGPDGTTPWYFFNTFGYQYSYAGENLAKDFDTSAGVTSGWMNSPGHRANILNSNFTDIGIAVANGVLLGSETTLVVAFYGQPSNYSPPPSTTEPTPTPTPSEPTPPPSTTDLAINSSSDSDSNLKLPIAASSDKNPSFASRLITSFKNLGLPLKITTSLLSLLLIALSFEIFHMFFIVKKQHQHVHLLLQASMISTAIIATLIKTLGVVG